MADLGFEFQESQKQIHDQGNPDLSKHRIAGCAEESFDFQVAFDPFEEEFNLPSLFVERGYSLCLQVDGRW